MTNNQSTTKHRIRYPITDKAKQAAQYLANEWSAGTLSQHFTITNVTAGPASGVEIAPGLGISTTTLPDLAILLELAQFHLLEMLPRTTIGVRGWDILLMQELHNAVSADFEVSDYFLTTQAVGTIILADEGSSIAFNSPFQSAASNLGDIQQHMETPTEIADMLTKTLGESVLGANVELVAAINDLRTATQANQETKVGNVISQLGHSLSYAGNTVTLVQALVALAPVLTHLIR